MAMTKQQIEEARELLADRTDRTETMIDGDGQCLTAYWTDGGQRVFYTLDDVKHHIETH